MLFIHSSFTINIVVFGVGWWAMLRTLSDMLQCWRRKPNSYWNKGWNVVPSCIVWNIWRKKKEKGERLRGKNFLYWENRFWFCQYFITLDVTRWVLTLYSSLWIFRLCIDFFFSLIRAGAAGECIQQFLNTLILIQNHCKIIFNWLKLLL